MGARLAFLGGHCNKVAVQPAVQWPMVDDTSVGVAAPTSPMMQAAILQGQLANGVAQPMNPQQVAQMQRRHMQQQQQEQGFTLPPYLQSVYNSTLIAYQKRFMQQAAAQRHYGNTSMLRQNEMIQIGQQARQVAIAAVRKYQANARNLGQQNAI